MQTGFKCTLLSITQLRVNPNPVRYAVFRCCMQYAKGRYTEATFITTKHETTQNANYKCVSPVHLTIILLQMYQNF